MTIFKIRFNTEHKESALKWRVLIDDVEYLAENIVINTLSQTSEEPLKEDPSIIKWHVKCTSNNFRWEGKILYID